MDWWEEAEARALRARTAGEMGQGLWQRTQAAGLDGDLTFTVALDLASLYGLCADHVRLVDGILTVADGDRPAVRRYGHALTRWAQHAEHWATTSAPAFNQLIDSLELDPDKLTHRSGDMLEPPSVQPEEEAKLSGRFQRYHLLYERLDLKLASIGLDEQMHRGLARSIARIYEQCLMTIRQIHAFQKEHSPRFSFTARMLLDLNTMWHFDLGPYHLGHGQFKLRGVAGPGLQTWLLMAFAG